MHRVAHRLDLPPKCHHLICVYAFAFVCERVCVCVGKKESARARETDYIEMTERGAKETERLDITPKCYHLICMSVCVCVRERNYRDTSEGDRASRHSPKMLPPNMGVCVCVCLYEREIPERRHIDE